MRLSIIPAVFAAALVAFAADPPASTNAPAAPGPGTAASKAAEELRGIMESDDEAQAEIDAWIREEDEFARQGAAAPGPTLRRRILERAEPVRRAYEDFLRWHPEDAKARLAFGSFLYDLDEEEGAREQLERALAGNPRNPVIYNNLANIYSHSGPVEKAFEFYARAMELKPDEGLYPRNLATLTYMFRQDAMKLYSLDEQGVFTRAMNLYSNALRLDPSNFPLASELAQTYYGIEPLRTNDALQAWTNAFRLARDEIEREGVHVHLARVKILTGRFEEARAHLAAVTNGMYTALKTRLARNLEARQNPAPAKPPAGPGGTPGK